ncbi:sensor histidine kinase [Maribellus maritimus]|uniref:sensor histidine kinase n=1 Tax=Maribellus maritimus TaxID=2870838 RepID=UPI001EE9B259|nr:histidine kinase [Maribellus maritimus]MCG6188226.1 histidine kinase [Maribellus maritimus]
MKVSKKIFFTRLKVFGGALGISLFFSLVLRGKLFGSGLWNMLVLTYIQLEIFLWLGNRFFRDIKRESVNYKRKMVSRLLKFYLAVLAIAFVIFMTVYTANFVLNGADFSYYFIGLREIEMKGFLTAALIGFSLGALFFFYVQWAEALQREQKLTREKLVFQYETLKNQVNPHFLFNSLNTLSSLVRENPDLSEEFIQKLSHIYRYVLRDKEKELVPLSEEIDFVRDYFYLRKIRDEEKIDLKIEISEMPGAKVLPVSLQLLVENALKHNSATRNNPLEIIIRTDGLDKLVIRNNLQKKTRWEESSKIGLKNLNERCKLILNQEVEIRETESEFVVKIPVKIESI